MEKVRNKENKKIRPTDGVGNFSISQFLNSLSPTGFTLLEMLIATGIFSVVILTAVGALVALSQAQVKASNIQNIQDNLRFALESMTREIRTGRDFEVSQCGPEGCSQLTFVRQDGTRVRYCLDESAVKKRVFPPELCESGSPITSSSVFVESLFFHLVKQGFGLQDGQPRITVVLEAESVNPTLRLETKMNLQTTVTARIRGQ